MLALGEYALRHANLKIRKSDNSLVEMQMAHLVEMQMVSKWHNVNPIFRLFTSTVSPTHSWCSSSSLDSSCSSSHGLSTLNHSESDTLGNNFGNRGTDIVPLVCFSVWIFLHTRVEVLPVPVYTKKKKNTNCFALTSVFHANTFMQVMFIYRLSICIDLSWLLYD